MARFDTGTATSGRITTSVARVKSINLYARTANTSNMYFGKSDVSLSNGRELVPGADITLDFDEGSELFSEFYLAGAGQVDWVVILE